MKKLAYIKGLKCPECGSTKVRSSGHAAGGKFKVHKRYQCDNCNFFTIHPKKVK